MDELASLTRDLVAIPSHEDETAAGDLIEEWMREHTDAAVLRDEVGNVIARRATADGDGSGYVLEDNNVVEGGKGPSLALIGHHDVVPPDGAQVDGDEYVVERRDGRLYGRGTADMKGAVAAAMIAFRDADADRDPDDDPAPELVFASFVGEEIGGEGARHAIDEGFAPDRAIVGEGSTGYSAPGVTDVAVAHKGRRAVTVTAWGESAHASEPEAGTNAIYRASDAIDVLRDLDAPAVEVAGERVEGSIVVTEIEGGSAWNVVPDRCEITVDERTVPGERADVERVESVDGVTREIDQDLPPMACEDDAFANGVLDAVAAAQDGSPEQVVKPHATDAGWLSEAGTECVICGPAEPGEAHTDSESVDLDVLDRCRRIYRAAAESRLSG